MREKGGVGGVGGGAFVLMTPVMNLFDTAPPTRLSPPSSPAPRPPLSSQKLKEKILAEFERKSGNLPSLSDGQERPWIDLTDFRSLWGPVIGLLEAFLSQQSKKLQEAVPLEMSLHKVPRPPPLPPSLPPPPLNSNPKPSTLKSEAMGPEP